MCVDATPDVAIGGVDAFVERDKGVLLDPVEVAVVTLADEGNLKIGTWVFAVAASLPFRDEASDFDIVLETFFEPGSDAVWRVLLGAATNTGGTE